MPKETKKPKSEIAKRVDSILAHLERQRADDDDDADGKSVPVERFRASVKAKNARILELETQLRSLGEAAEAAEAAHDAALQEAKTSAAREVAEVSTRHQQARELERLMLDADEDGIAEARRLYEGIPQDRRPKTMVEWYKSLTEETTPKTLRAYRKPAEEEDKKPVEKPDEKPPLKMPPRGSPSKPSKIKAEDILDSRSDTYKAIFGDS
jgi:hypothetical protein